MKEGKLELRKLILKEINNLDFGYRKKASCYLQKILHQFLVENKLIHKCIGTYYPLLDEIDPIFEREAWLFPRMRNVNLTFHRSHPSKLVEKSFFSKKFYEPEEGAKEEKPEVVIVPGVAFSRDGHRLGRGKGFYDRYLENKDIIKIGVCFHEQLLVDVPYEEHDIRMDYVISSKEIVKVG